MDLSIILPTYNEKKNISILVPQLEEMCKKHKISCEIVVCDDSSPDGTADESKKLNKKYQNVRTIVRPKKEGIGAALHQGYDSAKGDLIVSMDSDLSLDNEDIPKLIRLMKERGYDLVVGSRHLQGGGYEKKYFKTVVKSVMSSSGNWFIRTYLRLPVHDFSLNFRLIKRDVWKKISPLMKEKQHVWLLEQIYRVRHAGYNVGELPVTFKDRIYGESKTELSKQAPLFLKKAIRFGTEVRFQQLKSAARL